jgi:hypothetical protein
VAFDPIFDQPDSFASKLLSGAVDFSINPCRTSRKVACLNLAVYESGVGFRLQRISKSGVTNLVLESSSIGPVDMAVTALKNAHQRFSIYDRNLKEQISDLRAAFSTRGLKSDSLPTDQLSSTKSRRYFRRNFIRYQVVCIRCRSSSEASYNFDLSLDRNLSVAIQSSKGFVMAHVLTPALELLGRKIETISYLRKSVPHRMGIEIRQPHSLKSRSKYFSDPGCIRPMLSTNSFRCEVAI